MIVGAPVQMVPGTVLPSYVYFCSKPDGYFPYVPQCYGQWQRVVTNAVAVSSPAMQPQQIVAQRAPLPVGQMPSQPMSQREIDDRQLNSFGGATVSTMRLNGSRGIHLWAFNNAAYVSDCAIVECWRHQRPRSRIGYLSSRAIAVTIKRMDYP